MTQANQEDQGQSPRRIPVGWGPSAKFRVPLPRNEAERLATLRAYEVLDTPPEDIFDEITSLAATLCGTPIALISLVDSERQWFKARIGISAAETSRDIAFCAHAILQTDLFVVPDAVADARFADNPLVTSEPKIRFYAGAPLITKEDHAIGTLCVVDRVPRQLSAEQAAALRILGRHVIKLLELRRQVARLARQLGSVPQ